MLLKFYSPTFFYAIYTFFTDVKVFFLKMKRIRHYRGLCQICILIGKAVGYYVATHKVLVRKDSNRARSNFSFFPLFLLIRAPLPRPRPIDHDRNLIDLDRDR